MSTLRLEGLTKRFGEVRALDGVDLVMDERVVSIIGPNGAGKTTLFNVVTGMLKPDAGRVIFNGEDITGLTAHEISRRGIGRTFQLTNIFPGLNVYENIKIPVLSSTRQSSRVFSSETPEVQQRTLEILTIIGLRDRKEALCSALSYGEQRLVELGIAVAMRPQLLLLDEPTARLGPQETEGMISFIKELSRREEVRVILIEHDLRAAFTLSERIVAMHQGKVIADGKPSEIRNNPLVKSAYLGE